MKKKTASAKTAATNKAKSWARFDKVAVRAVAEFKVRNNKDVLAELRDAGITVPDDLARLCGGIDDEAPIDLTPLRGTATQKLHDLGGLYDANHPDEGSFGSLVASGELPAGLVMFGYGLHQLVYDTAGALGTLGAIWQFQDMSADGSVKLADSLESLLEKARAPVKEEEEPPPPRFAFQDRPRPAPFSPVPSADETFVRHSESPTAWFLLARGSELWFRGPARELASFDMSTQTWSTLCRLPEHFEIPTGVVLRDNSVLLFSWIYATKQHVCIRGDGRGEWTPVAGLPSDAGGSELGDSHIGKGVLVNGRVIAAGGERGRDSDTRSWIYDPIVDRWSPGPPLPVGARFDGVYSRPDGQPVFANRGGSLPATLHVFTLDDDVGRWTLTRESSEVTRTINGVLLHDGRVAFTGDADMATLIFDPRELSFRTHAAMPESEKASNVLELVDGVLGALRRVQIGESERELVACLDLSVAGATWRAGPLLPAEFKPHHIARHGEWIFLFSRVAEPGSFHGWSPASIVVLSAPCAKVVGQGR